MTLSGEAAGKWLEPGREAGTRRMAVTGATRNKIRLIEKLRALIHRCGGRGGVNLLAAEKRRLISIKSNPNDFEMKFHGVFAFSALRENPFSAVFPHARKIPGN